jgi:hypothetical protein
MGGYMRILNKKQKTPLPSVIAATAIRVVLFGFSIPSRVPHGMCEIFDIWREEIDNSDASTVFAVHKRKYAGVVP